MKKLVILSLALFAFHSTYSQDAKSTLLAELSENACKCIDSIDTFDKHYKDFSSEVSRCIDDQVGAYQLGAKLMGLNLDAVEEEGEEPKEVSININTNNQSDEYKRYYYEMERYLMENCQSLKEKINNNDLIGDKSMTDSDKASEYYNEGLDKFKEKDYKQALKLFKKAVKADDDFAFAWDNIGLCYRMMDDYDKAIEAYEKSLSIDPNGTMPLQNIAVAYIYRKDYQKAIDAYENLAKIDKDNPEVFYGIGVIYTMHLNDYEKALQNLCQAYNLYVEQKSPYRSDAEKVISIVYAQMKKEGKEERFNEILLSHNITPNEE